MYEEGEVGWDGSGWEEGWRDGCGRAEMGDRRGGEVARNENIVSSSKLGLGSDSKRR